MKPALRLALLPAVVLIALGAFLVACGGGDDDSSSGGSNTTQNQPAGNGASGDDRATSPGQAISMTDFAYSPVTIKAVAGEKITINLKNSGQTPHTFTIDGLVDSGELKPGDTKSISFTATSATVTYYCKVHGAATMSGQLGPNASPPASGTPSSSSYY